MSWWSRLANVVRAERVNGEIDEELQSHLEEAAVHGRDPDDARRALGGALQLRERSRDLRVAGWLDALRADAVFGWRLIRKNAVTSTAAILSLAVAIGACTAAFRLIDALLLRPLPIAAPERLLSITRHGFSREGTPRMYEEFEYPAFRQMRAAVVDQAELIAIAHTQQVDATYASDHEMERAHRQYVSGWMFGAFGLRPALGRLLTEEDDRTPGAHPYAVISHDYWAHRFARDPHVIGRTFRIGADRFEIVGVVEPAFTGTEPGTMTDIFVPATMHPGVGQDDWSWFRTFVQLKPGVAGEAVRARLEAVARPLRAARLHQFVGESQAVRDRYLAETFALQPAAAGVSDLQQEHRVALRALAALVALVLLIACANVANLMTAGAAARRREMALRVSIGAGRRRLVQLVLVQSAWLALLATVIGGLFAWWAAPFVVGLINPPDNPARLVLPWDWRVLGFGLALALGVTALFGLAPAINASAVTPVTALKGHDDPRSGRRLMHALIALQVAFCVLVLVGAGLFAASFDRLAHQPTGFSAERLVTFDAIAERPQPPALWDQVAAHLRTVPGVESVAQSGWALMDNNSWNGGVVIDGRPMFDTTSFFLGVSPGWLDVMKIPFVAGRDFRKGDTFPGAAIVNETWVKAHFGRENPIGRTFERPLENAPPVRFQIVGVVRDARYRNMREEILPVAYLPLDAIDAAGAPRPRGKSTFVVRTSSEDPLALAPILRREVPRAWPEMRVSQVRTQAALNQSHTVRERLLAMLALFFAGVALVLASVGLYGVLHYSVLRRRREIGIRLALGAPALDVARRIAAQIFVIVIAGAAAGLALGLLAERSVRPLLYQVRATDVAMLAYPIGIVLAAALLAAVPALVHALRIDPAKTLRTD